MTPKQLLEEIGDVRRQFKAGSENLAAGVMLGGLAMCGGIAAIYNPLSAAAQANWNLPWQTDQKDAWSWLQVIVISSIGLLLLAGGLALILWVRHLLSYRIWVGQLGLFIFDRKNARTIKWDNIASITETHYYERPPILKGAAGLLIPKMLTKAFALKLKEGKPFTFDQNGVRQHLEFVQMIHAETDARAVPWEIKVVHT